MQGCFTGIESTPRITRSDVIKEHIVQSDEQVYMCGIAQDPTSAWRKGKSFFVTDAKILLAMRASAPVDSTDISNKYISLSSIAESTGVTGDEMTILSFVTDSGSTLEYRIAIPLKQFLEKDNFDIPFTIEKCIIDNTRDRLKGNKYYITTPNWYDAEGLCAVQGLRHIPVEIVDVLPGNDIYPVRLVFRQLDKDKNTLYSIYMTIGAKRTSTQNFDTLFALADPKQKYPQITDDVWQLIIHSQVKNGMNKIECRLALGVPAVSGQRPTTAGMVEYWSYSDGVYLIFEEGYLTSFRK